MARTWLILDCNFLCYRAFYTREDLSYKEVPIGTTFGFLMDVMNLQTEFDTNNVIFCWDAGKGIRYDEYPGYKAKRKQKEETKAEKKAKKYFRRQIRKLRKEILPALGIRNNFWQVGYESDDVMAQVCLSLPPKDKAIIISADKDMYQCITPQITCYNPTTNSMMGMKKFGGTYGILPADWVTVKCLAGCTTDCVAGIKGIGEKKAIQYILKEMNSKTATYKRIKAEEIGITLQNMGLVKLPHVGTKEFKIRRKHYYTIERWDSLCCQYGFDSLLKRSFILEMDNGKKSKKKVSKRKKQRKQV